MKNINRCLAGGGIAVFIFAILISSISLISLPKRTDAVASTEIVEEEVSANVLDGTVTSITVTVDYTKTNEYNVQGVFTSMGTDDLIDGEYLSLNVEYDTGESETVTSGYTLSMDGTTFSEGNVNRVTVTYNNFSTTFLVNATAVRLDHLEVNTEGMSGNTFYQGNAISSLSEYIVVTGVNNDGSPYNNSQPIEYDATGANGYTLQGASSGQLDEGNNNIIVSYQGASGSFNVYGNEKVLESIEVEFTQPETPIYSSALLSDLSRYLTVNAYYNSSEEPEVLASNYYTITGDLFTSAEELETATVTRTLTVTVNGNEEITDTFSVAVTPDKPISVLVSRGSNYNQDHFALDELNTTGLTIMVTFQYGGMITVNKHYYVKYNSEDNRLHVSDEYVQIGYMENGVKATLSSNIPVVVSQMEITRVSMPSHDYTYIEKSDDPEEGEQVQDIQITYYDPTRMTIEQAYGSAEGMTIDEETGLLSAIEAGVYKVEITLASDYVWIGGSSDPIILEWEIKQREFSTSVNISSWNYGETHYGPSISSNPGDSEVVYYYYGTSDDGTYNHTKEEKWTTAPTVVGEYRVYAYINESRNYKEFTTSDSTFAVLIGTNVITAENYSWQYDEGNANKANPVFSTKFELETSYSIGYYQNGELIGTVNKYSADGTFIEENAVSEYFPQDVGTYTVKITVEGTANYNVCEKEITLTITPKPITIDPTMDTSNLTFQGSGSIGTAQSKVLSNYDSSKMTFTFKSTDGTTYTETENNGAYYVVSDSTITFYTTNVIADGGYQVVFEIGANYAWEDGGTDDLTFKWKMLQATNNVTITNEETLSQGWTYLDAGVTPEVSATFFAEGEPTITYYKANNETLGDSLGSEMPTDAGVYFVVASVVGTTNYSSASAQVKFEIKQKEVTIPTLNHESDVYNASVKTNVITGFDATSMTIEDSTTVTYEISSADINLTETNAGTYVLVISLSSTNYVWSDTTESEKTFTWTIEKASLTKPTLTSEIVYSGSQQSLDLSTLGVTSNMTVEISEDMQVAGLSLSGMTLSATDARAYTATISITDTANYKWAGDLDSTVAEKLTFTWTIGKATLAVNWGETNFTYTGRAIAPTPEFSGWLGTDKDGDSGNYTITVSGAKTDSGDNYTANLSIERKDGGNVNYTLSSTSTTFSIAKANLYVTWTNTTLTYNGEEQTPEYSLSDFVIPADANYYEFVFTTTGKNVDTYNTTLQLQRNDGGVVNYNLYNVSSTSAASTEFSIGVATLTVDWGDLEFEYDGSAKTPNPTVEGWFGSDEEKYEVVVSVEGDHINAGTYTAKLSLNSLQDEANYVLSDTEEEFEISKAKINVSEIVSEPAGVEGNEDLTDRRIPYTGKIIELVIETSTEGLYDFADDKYLNKDFVSTTLEAENFSAGCVIYIVLELTDNVNYEWSNYNANDSIVDDGKTIRLWYQVTQTQFNMQLSIPELNEEREIAYGESYTYEIGNNPNSAPYTVSYYKVEDEQETLLETAPVEAGDYKISVTIEASGDYDTMTSEIYYTITKRVVEITLNVENAVYGSFEGASVGAEITNLAGDGFDTLTPANFTFLYTSTDGKGYENAAAPTKVGTYSVEALLDAKNYTIDVTTKNFEITRADLDITINNAQITYGDEDPTVSYSGSNYITFDEEQLKYEDTIDSLGISFIYSTNYVQGDDAGGQYYIYLSNYSTTDAIKEVQLDNYNLTITRGTLSVAKKEINATVDIANGTFVYDGDNIYNLGQVAGATATPSYRYQNDVIEFTYTYSDGGDYNSETAPKDAGSYEVTVTIKAGTEADTNYSLTETVVKFEITKVHLDLTIKDATITYGDADVTATYDDATMLTYSAVQLKGEDTIDTIGLTFEYSTNYTQGANAGGEYYIYLSAYGEEENVSSSIKNYTLSITAGTLTVEKKTITASVNVDGKSYTYDGNNKYEGEVVGAVATPIDNYNGESVHFTYSYAGTGDTTYAASATAPTDVGTYQVTVSLQEGSISETNYIFEAMTVNYTITKMQVAVVWGGASEFVYNGANQISSITATYTPASDDSGNDGMLNIAIAVGESAFVNAGSYTLQASLFSDNEIKNYELVSNITKEFEIEKYTITEITWLETSENRFVYSGKAQSDNVVFATFAGAESESRTHNLTTDRILKNGDTELFRDAGEYQISVKLSDIDEVNYTFAEGVSLSYTYTIENADIEVSGGVSGYQGTYDATEHNVVSGDLPELTYIAQAGTPVWKYRIQNESAQGEYTETLLVKDAGSYTIEYIVELANHNSASGEFEVEISKKALNLTATTEVQFGNDITQNIEDYEITGEFAGSEDVDDLSGTVTFEAPDYTAGVSGVGNYTLTFSGFTSNNYEISYANGTVNVVPREIEVTIISIQRTYGEGLTALSADDQSTITKGAFSDEVKASTIYSLKAYDGEEEVTLSETLDVGSYDVKPVIIDNNYKIVNVINGEDAYVITQRPISIGISNTSYTYDGQRHGVTAKITTTGVNLEIRVLYAIGDGEETTDEPWEAGTYKVTVQIVNADEAGNYQINYDSEYELTISKRSISIAIENQSADYTGTMPTVSSEMGDGNDHKNWYISSDAGLCENVTGTMDDLNLKLSIPDGSINAGSYDITATYDNDNYTIVNIGTAKGRYTINKLNLEVAIQNQNITYGYGANEFVIEYSGFIAGESETTPNMFENGTIEATTTYEAGNSVGDYNITFVSEAVTSKNYNIIYKSGKITVSQRNITLQILPQESFYSGSVPTVSSEINVGWQVTSEVDIFEDDNLNVKLNIEASEVYNAGSYNITYTYSNENYNVTWQEGSDVDAFTIKQVVLTVTANDVEVQYGNQPVNSYKITGFVNNENEEVITGLEGIGYTNEGYSTTLGVATEPGVIKLTGVDGLEATNYSFVAADGKWTIIKRNIDLEVDESRFYLGQQDVYGEYDTETPFNYASVVVVSGGLVNADTEGDEGDVDVLFNYRYYGTSNDGTWNYAENGEGSSQIPDKAGTYKVVVTITSANYRLNSADETYTLTYTILKHRVTTPSWQTLSFDATGEERENTLTYEPDYSRVLTSSHPYTSDESGQISMKGTEGGEYSVTLILLDEDNYVWVSSTGSVTGDSPSVVIKWTISKNTDNEFTSEITILVDGEQVQAVEKEGKLWFDHTWIYEDVLSSPTATAKYGEVEFNYYYSTSNELVGKIPTDAGEYYVIASVEGGADWNGIESEPIYFTIETKTLELPTIEDVEYKGTQIKQQVKNFIFDKMITLGSNVELVFEENNLYLQATNVYSGEYFVNIALRDTKNYKWSDNSNATIRLSWNITPILVDKPTFTEQTFVYDGNVKTYVLQDSDDKNYYRIVRGGTGTNVSEYEIVVALVDSTNYKWSDESTANLTDTWSITPKLVEKPTFTPQSFTYNGETQTYAIQDSADKEFYSVIAGASAVNAGRYQIVIALNDKANYQWSDATTTDLTYEWSIAKQTVTAPTISAATYNHGNVVSTLIENYNNDILKIDSTGDAFVTTSEGYRVNAFNAGTYQITFSLRDKTNYQFASQEESVVVSWTVAPYRVAKPTLTESQSYTYTGEEIEYQIEDSADSAYYVVTGNTEIDVGIYNVQVALIDTVNYAWTEGGTAALTQEWTINAATDNKITILNSEEIADSYVYGENIATPIVSDTYGGEITITYFNAQGDSEIESDVPTDVGEYYITITSHSANNNFNDASVRIDFEITKATLTITPNSYTIAYGEELPTELEYAVEGLVGDDTIEDLGELQITCGYNTSNADTRKTGTYNITASGLDETNYDITYNQGQLVVGALNITIELNNQTSVYSGQEPVVDQLAYELRQELAYADDSLKIVISKQAGVNVGEYVLTATIDNNNYHATIQSATYEITKRHISASSLSFNDSVFVANGSVHQIRVSGDIPAGVVVEYTNNYKSLPGVYEVTANLVYDSQNVEIDGETVFTATMIINNPSLKIEENYLQSTVVVESSTGFHPNYYLASEKLTEFEDYDLSEFDGLTAKYGYRVALVDGENEVTDANAMRISLLIPDEIEFTKILLSSNGTLTELDYEIDGNYVVVETEALGEFLFVGAEEESDMLWLVIVLAACLLLVLIWFIASIVKARKLKKEKNNNVKVASVAPISLLLVALPTSQFVSIIVLASVILVLLIASSVITAKNRKKKKTEDVVVNAEIPQNDEVIDESDDDKDDSQELGQDAFIETGVDKDAIKLNFRNIRLKSFYTKLRQANKEMRERYYDTIRYLKTLPGVKFATSKRHVRVYKGRKTLALIFFKGKTICIAFALNPKDYENTKYRGTDVSHVKRFENTPMLLKLTSTRRLNNAKYLFSECVK